MAEEVVMAAVEEVEMVAVEGEIWEEAEIITFAIMAEGVEEITGGEVGEILVVIGMEEIMAEVGMEEEDQGEKEIIICQVNEGGGRRKLGLKKILYRR